MIPARFEPLAEDAWLIHVGTAMDAANNAQVHLLAARIRAVTPPWLRDLVPTYTSLGIFFDADIINSDDVRAWLHAQCLADSDTSTATLSRLVKIPVCYGGAFGEDLDAAAAEVGIAPAELISRHSAAIYMVAMIGFAPGFPYLLGLDPTLTLPRLATPRTHVPAGSVAIGGAQAGIYPHTSPGGWRLLGRTPLRLFDANRASPSLLAPGDRVRFEAIDIDRFAQLECEA